MAMSEKTLSQDKHEALLGRLRHPEDAIRVHAALRLAGPGIQPELVRAALEQALTDPDAHVRRLAAWVLARLAPAQQAA
jgi:hypothetical protein